MRIITKRTGAAAIIIATASMTAGCGGHGPNSYLMPKDAVVAKLEGAEREFLFADRDERTVRAIRRSGDTLKVQINYANSSVSSQTCEARVEAIDEEWSRVTPVCPEGENATDNLQSELNEMQIDEFVIAVLYDKPIDASMVFKRTSAVAIDNIGDITKEIHEEVQASENQTARAAAGWDSGDASGSDWGN